MRRRDFIILLGGTAVACPPAKLALAQQAKTYRVGILSILQRSSESVFLADHIGHIPVGRFIKTGPRRRLVKSLRESVLAESARGAPVGSR